MHALIFDPPALIGAFEVVTEKQALTLDESADRAILVLQVQLPLDQLAAVDKHYYCVHKQLHWRGKGGKKLKQSFDLGLPSVEPPKYTHVVAWLSQTLACLFKRPGSIYSRSEDILSHVICQMPPAFAQRQVALNVQKENYSPISDQILKIIEVCFDDTQFGMLNR